MKTVSIGFHRENGDFAILATLNNNDNHINAEIFNELVKLMTMTLEHATERRVVALERQDAPDHVETAQE
jgi:hypothetical protein